MDKIPFTAWEQGVFVVLFAVFIVALLGSMFVFVRWLLAWAQKREKDWQEFIAGLRTSDRTARAEDVKRMDEKHNEMTDAIQTMAQAITTLTSRFEIHVTEEYARFDVLMDDAQKARVAELSKRPHGRAK